MYKVECPGACPKEDACVVVLDDESVCRISPQKWKAIVEEGLQACGYLHDRKVVSISLIRNSAIEGHDLRENIKKRLTNERDKSKLNIVRNA